MVEDGGKYDYTIPITWPQWMQPSGVSVVHHALKTSDGLCVVVDDRPKGRK